METHGNQEGQIRHNKVKETFIFHMQILQPAVKLDPPPRTNIHSTDVTWENRSEIEKKLGNVQYNG